MMELLLLLLPVAAASGWVAAKRSEGKRQSLFPSRDPDYFKGLNYLLNEQPDKAIDVFVKMLEVDSETVETHLALGNLFRRRGEVDRAIRIHQNLIARPTLQGEHRSQALLELGQDYMRAGLYDRAESLFQELSESEQYRAEALRNLLVIYEREKEWDQSLKTARRLESITGEPFNDQCAHYYCELAEEAREGSDFSRVPDYLKRANSCDRDSVRAAMLLGEMEMTRGNYKAAIRLFEKTALGQHEFLTEILPSLRKCHQNLESMDKFRAFLERCLKQNKGLEEAIYLTDIIQAEEGEARAVSFLTDYLNEAPSLHGLYNLVSLNQEDDSVMSPEMRLLMQKTLDKLVDNKPGYKCSNCGFNAKTMHWQCPSCNNWSSIKPVQASI